ncbi:MAG: bifunctional GNAT family N-acetyltransferase/class I SAM-dependent methyltransferase [Clostridia bacterium]|nr:bifunctional GNAT family N-acetyltransferase/class I SAM-dependent methyltransferase [Clostridia bacterium]
MFENEGNLDLIENKLKEDTGGKGIDSKSRAKGTFTLLTKSKGFDDKFKEISKMDFKIIGIRENKEYLERAIDYFTAKWGIDRRIYADCISNCITTSSPLPRWYLMLKDEEIIGGYGLISNDFISRQDLFPWLCALYVEENYRSRQLGSKLMEHGRIEAGKLGYQKIYLSTDYNSYYEKYGWKHIANGFHPWGAESKIYVNNTITKVDCVGEQYNSMSFFYDVLYAGINPTVWEEAFIDEYRALLESLHPDARILDCSCGNGIQAAALSRNGFNVYASDISKEMIHLTEKYAKKSNLSFPVSCMAWSDLPQKYGEEFDVVFCWGNSISHSFDKQDMVNNLSSINKVLKKGGKLVIDSRNWDKLMNHYDRFQTYGVKEYDGKKFIPVYVWNLNSFNIRSNVEIAFIEIIDGKETTCRSFRLDFTPFSHDDFIERLRDTGFEISFDTFEEHKDEYYVVAQKKG